MRLVLSIPSRSPSFLYSISITGCQGRHFQLSTFRQCHFYKPFPQQDTGVQQNVENGLFLADSRVNTTLSAPAHIVFKYQRLGRFALLDLLEKAENCSFSTLVEAGRGCALQNRPDLVKEPGMRMERTLWS